MAGKHLQYELLTGVEKAAILMMAISPQRVQELMQRLDDDEVERILASVSRFDTIPSSTLEKVLREFQEAIGKHEISIQGGREQALALISGSIDADRASRLMEKLGRDEKRIDWTLRDYSPEFIADQLGNEHPQSIALILAQLPSERGASVVAHLSDDVRAEVMLRVANLETVSSNVIHELEDEIAMMFQRRVGAPTPLGGTEVAAKLLNGVPKADGQLILDKMDSRDPEIAADIRKMMLTFNDLETIDQRGFQALLREIPTEDLVIALKTASDEMKDKVFSNVSSRAADQIREESDLLPPMRLSEIEQVQRQIVDVARRLEEEGVLSIDTGGGGDDVLV
ncbi:MAG: flagellar motor switch protein FliG [Spirochaetaceae bacterium]|nr:flagellar motor switch protein FliG [Myxococcales bacterium]MCB9726577.1 flagellar motor switch protein FliG [Spirochaetaceae bacterium]